MFNLHQLGKEDNQTPKKRYAQVKLNDILQTQKTQRWFNYFFIILNLNVIVTGIHLLIIFQWLLTIAQRYCEEGKLRKINSTETEQNIKN